MFYRDDERYMREALVQANQAYAQGEVPIGAVIVDAHGVVIAAGYNLTESKKCQIEHAEMNAIRAACTVLGDWRLNGCTIYVTLEPCVMCLGCIVLSRIERLVYGSRSPQFGYHFGNENMCELYAKNIKNITEGVCARESEALLKKFFYEQRGR